MEKNYSEKKQNFTQTINQLDNLLKEKRAKVLKRASDLLGYDINIHEFHGSIGGKNNIYANVENLQFDSVESFLSIWLQGLTDRYNKKDQRYDSDKVLIKLMKDNICREYIFIFLKRNFYKQYKERTRKKPQKELHEIWFGSKTIWGLILALEITPDGSWRIDHSEIRRSPYNYWTVGHIINVGGFIDAKNNLLLPINSLKDLCNFYTIHILSKSQSKYERDICELYMEYLKSSQDYLSEPFLIPEFRYEGRIINHKFRLDFTILNPYTSEFVGFEISPSSTHMYLNEKKELSHKEINHTFYSQWKKECDKRHEYFNRFGITTITFFDEELQDIKRCFEKMKQYLSKRTEKTPSLEVLIKRIEKI